MQGMSLTQLTVGISNVHGLEIHPCLLRAAGNPPLTELEKCHLPFKSGSGSSVSRRSFCLCHSRDVVHCARLGMPHVCHTACPGHRLGQQALHTAPQSCRGQERGHQPQWAPWWGQPHTRGTPGRLDAKRFCRDR